MFWLNVSKGLSYATGGIVLILASYNIYNFVYKQQKYKVWTILLFYIFTVLILISSIWVAAILPFDNYCALVW